MAAWVRLAHVLYIVLVALPAMVWPCADPPTNARALHDLPHLQALFHRYAQGDVITPEGLRSLLLSLGLFKEGHDNATKDKHGRHDHSHEHGHDDHVTHDHNPDDRRKGAKDQRAHQDHHNGDEPKGPPGIHPVGDDHDHDHGEVVGHSSRPARHTNVTVEGDLTPVRGSEELGRVNTSEAESSSGHDSAGPGHATPPARPDKCGLAWALDGSGLGPRDSISPLGFLKLCPGLVHSALDCTMDDHHTHSHQTKEEFSSDNWIGAVVSMVVIGLVGLACIMAIPALKRSTYYDLVNHFLLALAVGTLAGDALIHLLPHAISMEIPAGSNPHLLHAFYGFTALGGIIMFLFLERCHNLFCGHGHSHGGHQHGLGLDLSKSKEDIDKETVGTTTTLEDSTSQITDKIGEKLSKHSKHNSFIYAESTMTLETQNCFEGCSSNVSPSSDANGNSGPEHSRFGDNPSTPPPEKQVLVGAELDSEVSSIDKHIAMCVEKKMACSASEKESLVTTPAERSDLGKELSLILDAPSNRPRVLRQNSSSFNMVLQEYHVGHHGHSHHGHSHVAGRKDSLRAMILVGDAMHTFLDGMAIGAAFGTSVTGGVATSIAVLCHELPHKVGDFALLFEMGMGVRQAVKMMGLLWLLSLLGLLVGVLLGSIETASPWIYSFTAGVFIYLALVDLLSELSVSRGERFGVGGQLMLQGLGMLTGATIMLVIAIYEHDLEDLLKGSF